MMTRVFQFLFPLLCYAFPLLCVYLSMKIDIYGHYTDEGDIKEKAIKRHYKKAAIVACMLVCTARLTAGYLSPFDDMTSYIWLFWSTYKIFDKGYNEGFNEGYNCAKEELENEYRKKLQEEVKNKW